LRIFVVSNYIVSLHSMNLSSSGTSLQPRRFYNTSKLTA